MRNIKNFVISDVAPDSNNVGWLKPEKDGKYSLYICGPNGWAPLASDSSEDIPDSKIFEAGSIYDMNSNGETTQQFLDERGFTEEVIKKITNGEILYVKFVEDGFTTLLPVTFAEWYDDGEWDVSIGGYKQTTSSSTTELAVYMENLGGVVTSEYFEV